MAAAPPSIVVLAGPNGAGKSTMATRLVVGPFEVSEFVDADVLARRLPLPEGVAAIAAGRAVLRRLDELEAGRRSFGFESTLATRSLGSRLRRLISAGYNVHLGFLWLESADLAVARVAGRVRLGGHAVPEATVRRRYRSGLQNFFGIYQPLTTTWRMYDNSRDTLRLIASGTGTRTLTVDDVDRWRHIEAEADREDE